MPKFKRYTAKMVERQIRAIAKRNPDNINPQDHGDCVYHQGRGRNIKRCLIGQWGYEQGFRTPNPVNGSVDEVIEDIWGKQAEFEPDAIFLMGRYQSKADGSEYAEPRPWKEVLVLS